MDIIAEINKYKVPIFKVNPALDAYLEIPMFEDKIAAANEILRTIGLPKEPKIKKAKRVSKKQTVSKKTVSKS
ncbi:MAG: hypothetical protein RLZZ292_2486 [Bacteroidota bacterium]|jgi:hypothetical protein